MKTRDQMEDELSEIIGEPEINLGEHVCNLWDLVPNGDDIELTYGDIMFDKLLKWHKKYRNL